MSNNLGKFLCGYVEGNEPDLDCEERERKPVGYWTDFNNLKSELEIVIKEIGHFPIEKELEERKLSYASAAIEKYHNGVNAVRKKMGYEIEIRDRGYWKEWENIERELKKIIKKLGHFPTQKELRKLKMSSLSSGIDNHGGVHVVSKKLGMTGVEKFPKGYWQDEENVLSEYKKITEELGHAPSNNELCKLGYAGLSDSISKNYGSIFEIRNKLEIETDRKENGYYSDIENINSELKKIYEEHPELNDIMPSVTWMEKNGYSKLYAGIRNYHGGINNFRKKSGLEINREANGYWKEWDNVKKELDNIMNEFGYIPGVWTLNRIGKKSLGAAIYQYHGGINKTREKFMSEIGVIQENVENKQLENLLLEYTA